MRKLKRFIIRNEKKLEIVADFLIKFNLLSIPMYVILLTGLQFYPLQTLLTNTVYEIFKLMGYSLEKHFTTILFSKPFVAKITMDMDCTAWKSMYALAALIIASPVKGDKKWKYTLLGILVIFALNIVRIVSTVLIAGIIGLQYLDIIHTVFWREGMILAVVLIWVWWIKRQKIIFQEEQSIVRKLYKSD